MKRTDASIAAVMMAAAFSFAVAAGVNICRIRKTREDAISRQYVHVLVTDVVGSSSDFRGDPRSPYTLVEFADYQCPACQVTEGRLPSYLASFRGKVRFEFRNMPLVRIHPYAEPAAEAAEIARQYGKFWTIHDELYNLPSLNMESIHDVMRENNLNDKFADEAAVRSAKEHVLTDVKAAEIIGVDATPTFFVCMPDGRVLRLGDLSQISEVI